MFGSPRSAPDYRAGDAVIPPAEARQGISYRGSALTAPYLSPSAGRFNLSRLEQTGWGMRLYHRPETFGDRTVVTYECYILCSSSRTNSEVMLAGELKVILGEPRAGL
ncbi:hypothetical protein J6590_030908 [Homalodisca vitripennis]|nr:hypothetical protein J6590_030908 [Homalodisca vitripennis]